MGEQNSLFGSSVIDPEGEDGLGPLRKKCAECTKCDLAKNRVTAVFGEGNGNCPDLFFIGEAPGPSEDLQGRPFVGRAGMLLDRMIGAMGYRREDVYLCNAVNCRPDNNRPPEKREIEACFEYLIGQVRAVRPKVIVALGATAFASLFGGKKKITEIRGKWQEFEGIPVLPTYHPVTLTQAEHEPQFRDLKKIVWGDLQLALNKLGRVT